MKMRHSLKFKRADPGFTLAELMVAMSVFIVVTTVAVGAYVQALRSERRLVTLVSVTNDVQTALEEMAREIRTGYLFTTSPAGGTLQFINADGTSTVYSVVGGILERDGEAITSENTRVDNLHFIVSQDGSGHTACYPWRVVILLGIGAAGASQNVIPDQIQTTVSSRILPKDVPPQFKYSSAEISGCY